MFVFFSLQQAALQSNMCEREHGEWVLEWKAACQRATNTWIPHSGWEQCRASNDYYCVFYTTKLPQDPQRLISRMGDDIYVHLIHFWLFPLSDWSNRKIHLESSLLRLFHTQTRCFFFFSPSPQASITSPPPTQTSEAPWTSTSRLIVKQEMLWEWNWWEEIQCVGNAVHCRLRRGERRASTWRREESLGQAEVCNIRSFYKRRAPSRWVWDGLRESCVGDCKAWIPVFAASSVKTSRWRRKDPSPHDGLKQLEAENRVSDFIFFFFCRKFHVVNFFIRGSQRMN